MNQKLEPSKPVTLNNITFEYVRDVSNPSGRTAEAASALPALASQVNQTGEESSSVLQGNLEAPGSGLFLIPDPHKLGHLNLGVTLVCNLDYTETVLKGANCSAFRWVADEVKTCKELEGMFAQKASPCLGDVCPNPPCAIPCMCDSGKGRCQGKWGPL